MTPDPVREALEELIGECERANETCLRQIGMGVIDLNAICAARATLSHPPAAAEPVAYGMKARTTGKIIDAFHSPDESFTIPLYDAPQAARDLAGPTQEDLRRLVAEVWCYVGFDPSVPEHVADALITKALGKEKA